MLEQQVDKNLVPRLFTLYCKLLQGSFNYLLKTIHFQQHQRSKTNVELRMKHLCISQFQQCPSPPPRATAGHLLTLSVPGVGHSQFYRAPGGWVLAYPGANPGHLTMCFRKTYKLIGEDEAFVKDWLIRDQKNLSMFLKVCFLNFRYFFITCKHTNISDKVNYMYILFITKQSLT